MVAVHGGGGRRDDGADGDDGSAHTQCVLSSPRLCSWSVHPAGTALLGHSLGESWKTNGSLALSFLTVKVLLSLLFLRLVAAFAVGSLRVAALGVVMGLRLCSQ